MGNQDDLIQPIDRQLREKLISEAMPNLLEGVGIGKIYWNVDIKKIEPRKSIDNYINRLLENINNGLGIFLSGGIGVGKTTILSYIAQETLKIGSFSGYIDDNKPVIQKWVPRFNVLFCSVSRLFNLIFERNEKIEQYRKCDLFLLDDFGREYSTDFPLSKFEDIIEYRYSEMKSTCITTNLSKDQLRRMRIYARIIDRWADPKLFRFIEIAGKSKRTL